MRFGEYSRFHGYAYDGIWAAATALDDVEQTLRAQNSLLSLKDFRYRDPFWGTLLKEALNRTKFTGVTVSSVKLFLFRLAFFKKLGQPRLRYIGGWDQEHSIQMP